MGFIHKVTGQKLVFSVSGESIHDPTTGTFLGAIGRFQDMEELSKLLRIRLFSSEVLTLFTVCEF